MVITEPPIQGWLAQLLNTPAHSYARDLANQEIIRHYFPRTFRKNVPRKLLFLRTFLESRPGGGLRYEAETLIIALMNRAYLGRPSGKAITQFSTQKKHPPEVMVTTIHSYVISGRSLEFEITARLIEKVANQLRPDQIDHLVALFNFGMRSSHFKSEAESAARYARLLRTPALTQFQPQPPPCGSCLGCVKGIFKKA